VLNHLLSWLDYGPDLHLRFDRLVRDARVWTLEPLCDRTEPAQRRRGDYFPK